MPNFRMVLSILILIPMLSGCVATAVVGGSTAAIHDERSLGNQLDDTSITAKIDARLIAEKDMPSRWISVQTIEGVVTLTGYLPSPSHIKRAIYITKSVKGVQSVHSELEIGTPAIKGLFSDSWITAQAKTRLWKDEVVSGFSIHVETVDGKVYLQGIVNDFTHRQHAKKLVLGVKGVTAVVDLMKSNQK
jgi:osmotically-inducible protein OsmY